MSSNEALVVIPFEIFDKFLPHCEFKDLAHLRQTCSAAASNTQLAKTIAPYALNNHMIKRRMMGNNGAIKVFGPYIGVEHFTSLDYLGSSCLRVYCQYHTNILSDKDWIYISTLPQLCPEFLIQFRDKINWHRRAEANLGAVPKEVAELLILTWDTPIIVDLHVDGKTLRKHFDYVDWKVYFQLSKPHWYHELAHIHDLIDWKLLVENSSSRTIGAMYEKYRHYLDPYLNITSKRDYTYREFRVIASRIDVIDWLHNEAQLTEYDPYDDKLSLVDCIYQNTPYTKKEIRELLKRKPFYTSSAPSSSVPKNQP